MMIKSQYSYAVMVFNAGLSRMKAKNPQVSRGATALDRNTGIGDHVLRSPVKGDYHKDKIPPSGYLTCILCLSMYFTAGRSHALL